MNKYNKLACMVRSERLTVFCCTCLGEVKAHYNICSYAHTKQAGMGQFRLLSTPTGQVINATFNKRSKNKSGSSEENKSIFF